MVIEKSWKLYSIFNDYFNKAKEIYIHILCASDEI